MKFSKEGILFLWLDQNQFHAQESLKRGVSVKQIYKNLNKVQKTFRNIQIILRTSTISYWFSDWKEHLDKYHTVIVHASILTPEVVKYIRKKNKNIRIIVWYWNPVGKSVDFLKFSEAEAEIWVFDESDAINYSLEFNTQYYFKDFTISHEEVIYDVSFVGADKGRIDLIHELNEEFSNFNIKTYFHVIETNGIKENHRQYYKNRLEYKELLDIISKSKVILDIVSKGQTGLTLRPLEALFFKKKLITNDKRIVNRDFYESENIFVLGMNKIEDLSKFINTPYKPIDEKILNRYDFDNWLNRFFEKDR